MITRVIEVLRSWSFVTRGRAATRTAPTTACATLDAAAQTINHARNHRDEDDCADNDTNDDGPFAIRFCHALVPTRECIRRRLEVADYVPRP